MKHSKEANLPVPAAIVKECVNSDDQLYKVMVSSLGISPEQLQGDWDKVNYSSTRVATKSLNKHYSENTHQNHKLIKP